jgi:gluconokinase
MLAAAEPRSHDLVVLRFLAGERSPGWRGGRRGAIAGLALDTTAVEITRAMLEAVALRLALVYDLLVPCADADHAVVASGGSVEQSPAWVQMIADAIGRPIVRAREAQATSRGVALLALDALGAGPGLAAGPPPPGDRIEPDLARHARYRAALGRQQDLDARW